MWRTILTPNGVWYNCYLHMDGSDGQWHKHDLFEVLAKLNVLDQFVMDYSDTYELVIKEKHR